MLKINWLMSWRGRLLNNINTLILWNKLFIKEIRY
jgi:hypothetical protein